MTGDLAVIALGAENLALIGAGYRLLRQGGGIQVKAPSSPRKATQKAPAEPADTTTPLKEVA